MIPQPPRISSLLPQMPPATLTSHGPSPPSPTGDGCGQRGGSSRQRLQQDSLGGAWGSPPRPSGPPRGLGLDGGCPAAGRDPLCLYSPRCLPCCGIRGVRGGVVTPPFPLICLSAAYRHQGGYRAAEGLALSSPPARGGWGPVGTELRGRRWAEGAAGGSRGTSEGGHTQARGSEAEERPEESEQWDEVGDPGSDFTCRSGGASGAHDW